MDIIAGVSLLTAFLAGIAALFAPCCITVLLPSYFASIFRQKRKIFLMTFIFFLGILAVFLPLGLGFGALGLLISQYHDLIFILGGLFLVFLGLAILGGFHLAMPFSVSPRLNIQNSGSIFVLGIFSGLATTCCAPVLAGVLALSVLPGSVFWGGMYSLTYVLGMVLPLFVISLFLDKINFTEKFQIFGKFAEYAIFGKKIKISYPSFFSGLMFFLMGVLILYLDLTGNLQMRSSYQAIVNARIAGFIDSLAGFIKNVPDFIFPLLIFFLIFVIIKIVIRSR